MVHVFTRIDPVAAAASDGEGKQASLGPEQLIAFSELATFQKMVNAKCFSLNRRRRVLEILKVRIRKAVVDGGTRKCGSSEVLCGLSEVRWGVSEVSWGMSEVSWGVSEVRCGVSEVGCGEGWVKWTGVGCVK